MPKLSERTWNLRRRHVLESAFRCFARTGFDATTVEDVAAESGWSLGVVYRHVPSKDDLVNAALSETLGVLEAFIDGLLARDPLPTPRQTVRAMIDLFDDAGNDRSYPLGGLIIQAWAEGLRRPEMAVRSQNSWQGDHRRLTTLARRWKQAGYLGDDARPADTASTLALTLRGIVVDQTHFGGNASRGALRQTDLWAR